MMKRKRLVVIGLLVLLTMGGCIMANGGSWAYDFPDRMGTRTWLDTVRRVTQQYPDWRGIGTSYPTVTPPGETAFRREPRPREAGVSEYERWTPYLRGLGIYPQSSGWLTPTSPAFRGRMNPMALDAMRQYLASIGKNWADYSTYSQSFMPQTPQMYPRS